MYENQATAQAPAGTEGIFKPRGQHRTVAGYAPMAPLPTQSAPLSALDAVPAAPAAVTAPPAPTHFTSALGGFEEVAPTHAPTFGAPAPTLEAAPAHFEQPAAFAPAPFEAPAAFEPAAPSFAQAPIPAEPIAFPTAAPAPDAYVPQSFTAAFGGEAPQLNGADSGAQYAHAPAVPGPFEPLPSTQILTSPGAFGAGQTTPAFEAAVAGAAQEEAPAAAAPEAAALEAGPVESRYSPQTNQAVATLLQVLETEDVKQATGDIQLHARALKVMLQEVESEAGENKLYSEGFRTIEKLARGLPKGDTLNALLDNSEVLLRDEMVTSVDVHSARKENALTAMAGAQQVHAGLAMGENQQQSSFAAQEAARRAEQEQRYPNGVGQGQYL